MNKTRRNHSRPLFLKWLAAGLALSLFGSVLTVAAFGAEETSLSDRAKAVGTETQAAVADTVEEAKEAVRDAGRSAEKTLENLWRSIDEQRLKNRTPDQIVAWAIMGVLVGAVAGMATSLKTTGLGKAGRILLGLAGAFIGGIVVHAARIDFGWGPVLIRYEDLLFSLVGALALVVIGRFLRSRSKKQPASKS
jgi:uncharacterized membrane protein YeaQ/YmgE (transglycosylase-associated protein family)